MLAQPTSAAQLRGGSRRYACLDSSGGQAFFPLLVYFFPPSLLFKFPQMDFEMAIWEMTSLLIAPKKVFKSMYYHVSNRAFFPLYLHLYVLQFLLLPILTRNSSSSESSPSTLATVLGNTLYLSALTYYTYITFLGYNALPFLHHTELLLAPILIFAVLWLVSLIVGWGIVGQGMIVEGMFWGI
ncbi:conserved hypothetical protein [Histoplasma capsulatum G186AR]|uniref:Integral membrane protein n=1 Tax=Ajellomyces capsulatus (strain G186AR / H82 / ATCC MYA-2454 / RMSCC 2432) TaxID=447093 RepID=C0NJ06_AJECG|nr:uncharacterized protein HCBG_03136 [Histoplasma capsulatum G186AR]EEH07847.1 conserved hypothetical protein [Histoplasma capsulatum G186AR]